MFTRCTWSPNLSVQLHHSSETARSSPIWIKRTRTHNSRGTQLSLMWSSVSYFDLQCVLGVCVIVSGYVCARVFACSWLSFSLVTRNLRKRTRRFVTNRKRERQSNRSEEKGSEMRRTKVCTNHDFQFVSFEKIWRFNADLKYTIGITKEKRWA